MSVLVRGAGLVLAALLASVSAAAGQEPYVDPALRPLLRPEVRAAADAALRIRPPDADRPPSYGGLVLDAAGPTGEARVGVFVRLRTPGAVAELQAAGVEIGSVVGDIATARVPLSALPALGTAVGVERIESARVVRRSNDRAVAAVRADRVRSRAGGAWQGWAGQGVVVGVYDTGLDYRHADFHDADGQTRLLGLWDQTQAGTPPSGFGYGLYCDVAALQNEACPQRDNDGHGTHVAGSAAGNGSAAGPDARYAGVAPAASLLIVKGGEDSFPEDRIVEGIDWVFREASRLGLPAVVNLSLGGQYGAHDGTRLYEQALDQLSGSGRIVVVAAGNEGANASAPAPPQRIHATAVPAAGTTQRFTINVPAYTPEPGPRGNRVGISFWYGGADRLRVAVVRPDGSRLAVEPGAFRQDDSAAGGVYVDNASSGPDPENGDNHALILIEDLPGSGAPAAGTWAVEVTTLAAPAARRYHFWIFDNTVGANGSGSGFVNSHLVGSPGTARQAVTVGAFVTRLRWTSIDGSEYRFGGEMDQEALGDIASFSSPGPTRDGRRKPELAAPGKVVVSSRSRHAQVPEPLIVPGGAHFALQGTSMASPIAAGGVALLLQRAPSLTPEEVKRVLTGTTIRDGFTQRSYVPGDAGGTPNQTWGWGKLDAEAAVAAAAGFARVSVLGVTVEPIRPTTAPSVRRGTRVPLLHLALTADGPEALDVTALGFGLVGADPGARLLLFRDLDGDGAIGAEDPLLAALPLALEPDDTLDTVVSLAPPALRVPAGSEMHLLVALESSGAAPHAAPLQAWFRPDGTRAVGAETGEPSRLRQPAAAVRSDEVRPTLLEPGEVMTLSENPVRSDRLVLHFRSAPRTAAIHTVSGRRVVDLLPLLEADSRIVWDLTNQQGTPVAPGVYLAVFRIGDETIRERLIITRPAGGRE